MSRRVALVRHGRPAADHCARLIGSSDVPIDETRSTDLVGLTSQVQALGATRVYCSPARRARETARQVLGLPEPDLVVDPDLREIDFGRWEGKTFTEVEAEDPAAVARWGSGDPEFAFPGGERIDEFLMRVRRGASRLAGDAADTVLAFTHGGVIRHLICHYLDLPEPRHSLLFEIQHASVALIALFGGKGVLTGLNLSSSRVP